MASACLGANQCLDLAADLSDKAVADAEAATLGTTLRQVDAASLAREGLLPVYWQTRGLVLARQGDPRTAARYVAAAFALTEFPPFANNEGDDDLAANDRAAAAIAYAEAPLGRTPAPPPGVPAMLSGGRGANAPLGTVGPPYSPKFNIAASTEAERAQAIAAANAAVARLSGIDLPAVAGATGTAEFDIALVNDGTVVETRFISGAEPLRAMADRFAQIKMPVLVPDGRPVKIIRRGTMTCAPGAPMCHFALTPVNQVMTIPPTR